MAESGGGPARPSKTRNVTFAVPLVVKRVKPTAGIDCVKDIQPVKRSRLTVRTRTNTKNAPRTKSKAETRDVTAPQTGAKRKWTPPARKDQSSLACSTGLLGRMKIESVLPEAVPVDKTLKQLRQRDAVRPSLMQQATDIMLEIFGLHEIPENGLPDALAVLPKNFAAVFAKNFQPPRLTRLGSQSTIRASMFRGVKELSPLSSLFYSPMKTLLDLIRTWDRHHYCFPLVPVVREHEGAAASDSPRLRFTKAEGETPAFEESLSIPEYAEKNSDMAIGNLGGGWSDLTSVSFVENDFLSIVPSEEIDQLHQVLNEVF